MIPVLACSVCNVEMRRSEHAQCFICPNCAGVITDEEVHRLGLLTPRIDPSCTEESTMTDTPAGSADSATSSPASPGTAKNETSVEPEIDFTFKRAPEKVVISGMQPYVLLTLHDRGVKIQGGGLPETAPTGAVIEFLMAAGDTFHEMARQMQAQVDGTDV